MTQEVAPILVLGGYGQLGTALRNVIGDVSIAPTHSDFDIVTGNISELIGGFQPKAIINCAAFHNVDRCEREPLTGFETNAVAVDRLAAASAAHDVLFVTISTDYVFSGNASRPYREDDVPAPQTAYGISKYAGELAVRRHGPRHIIVRTSGVYGTIGTSSKGYTLIEKVLAQAERGDATKMVADMVFSPSFAPHIAATIMGLVERQAFGTHHVTNAGQCSWFEFVAAAFERAGLPDAILEPITYESLGNETKRPMYSPLENTTLAQLGLAPMPTWDQALDEFLACRRARLAQVVKLPPD